MSTFTRKSIIKKTVQVGSSTLMSRFFGIVRELLMVRYLGASALSDAFITAFKIPNSLRKIFAEGAMSATFVPTIVHTMRQEKDKYSIAGLMSLGFLFFEGAVLVLCALTMLYAYQVIMIIAPGFSVEQAQQASVFLYILMPFIFFISSSALLAGPLQAVGHFFVPAFAPVLLNIVFIIGLLICLYFSLPVTILCWFILFGGVIQLIAHFFTYFKLGFSFGIISKRDTLKFISTLPKFLMCLLSMSVMELGLFLDTSFGSLLSKGSLSLIYYANRFMGIPLGVFGVALSTILLPHFSRIASYAPRRLGFYLLEATKLVWWVMLPLSCMMIIMSKKIFITIFLSSKFTLAQAHQAGEILAVFAVGLFFFAINKIVSNVYYALHNTWIPGLIAVIAVVSNGLLNWLLIDYWGAYGLVIATIIASIIQTVALFVCLIYWFNFSLYASQLGFFIWRSSVQCVVIGIPFYLTYWAIDTMLAYAALPITLFFFEKVGFWLWITPLAFGYMVALYKTRKLFKVRMVFLEEL